MEFVRQIIDSNLLDKISLPESLRNTQVEIIILPIDKKSATSDTLNKPVSLESIIGTLSSYANPDLIPLEKEAWSEAVYEKHINR
ncbi:MAG: hypothetical protein FWC47_08075 [Oscillospiraceae bacterium]|nr:hypothetical protein [Oscillospiraceae bacterium]